MATPLKLAKGKHVPSTKSLVSRSLKSTLHFPVGGFDRFLKSTAVAAAGKNKKKPDRGGGGVSPFISAAVECVAAAESKKLASGGLAGNQLKRTLPATRPSLNYLLMQYFLNTKRGMEFDPIYALNHFVEPGMVEASAVGLANAQGLDLDKRARFAPFFDRSTSKIQPHTESKSLEAGKKLTHFIHQSNHLRFGETTGSNISLFPFFGSTFFALKDGVGVHNSRVFEHTREQQKFLRTLRKRCWKLMAKDEVRELVDKFIDLGGTAELIKATEMMTAIIMRNRIIPYGGNFYLNEVKKMRSLLSNGTKTNVSIESVKTKSSYQSASLIAQEISLQLRGKGRSFRSIFNQIVKEIRLEMKSGVQGVRVLVSGRLKGAEIARSECGKWGRTSRNSFSQKIDYAFAQAPTRYGIIGVKVWITYSHKKGGRSKSEA